MSCTFPTHCIWDWNQTQWKECFSFPLKYVKISWEGVASKSRDLELSTCGTGFDSPSQIWFASLDFLEGWGSFCGVIMLSFFWINLFYFHSRKVEGNIYNGCRPFLFEQFGSSPNNLFIPMVALAVLHGEPGDAPGDHYSHNFKTKPEKCFETPVLFTDDGRHLIFIISCFNEKLF